MTNAESIKRAEAIMAITDDLEKDIGMLPWYKVIAVYEKHVNAMRKELLRTARRQFPSQ